jgi:WD40 repeat protein
MFQAKSNIILYSILVLVIFATSCKKEELDIPVVNILRPYENQHFTIGDTIEIDFNIESKSKIGSIEISIVDENLKPVLANYSYKSLIGERGGTVHFAIILSDDFMSAGRYQVMAKVTNEQETKHKYQWIEVGVPNRKLLGLAVITKSPNKVNVWNYDLNFNKTIKKVMIGDYGGSVYLPFHNRMALSAKVQGFYTIWDYPSGDTILNLQTLGNPPFPYYTGTTIVDDKLSVQYYAGAFSLMNYNGQIVTNVPTTSGYFPQKVFDVGDNFVSIEYSKSSIKKLLVTHIGSTGMNYATYQLKGPVIGAFPFENKDFMMFSNYYGYGHIEKYIWDDNATNDLSIYSMGDEFIDAIQMGDKEYLLLTKRAVLWYKYSRGSTPAVVKLSVADPIKIQYDDISRTIWVADKHGFSIYSFPLGNVLSDYRINEEVLNFHLIYSR